jgi:dTDP-4-dehydrorhamnose reductase
MNLLVTGCRGMLGQDLIPRLKDAGFEQQCVDIAEMDITKRDLVLNRVGAIKPDLVINCSAYTAVDKAESEQDLAFAVNRDGPGHLADACNKLGIPLIHISTDYVFDGQSSRPYREDDSANPIGVYAQSKWEGEEEVRRRLERHIIVRTSWLFGYHGSNFVKTILRLAGERDQLKVVKDQKGCPTWTGHLAEALAQIAERIRTNIKDAPWGTYHYCGKGATTWFDFAVDIVEQARRYRDLKVSQIAPIPTSEYPTPAKRPMNSELDCGKIRRELRIEQGLWKEGLRIVLEEMMGTKQAGKLGG